MIPYRLKLALLFSAIVTLSACTTSQNKSDKPGTVVSSTTTATTAKPSAPAWLPKLETRSYQAARTQKNDLLHTKLEVSFDWSKQYLLGKAMLTFKPYFYPQNTLQLDARGFEIKSIKLQKTNEDLKYTYEKDVINITLDKTYTRDEEYVVVIDYVAKPNELKSGGSAAITSDKGLYFINPDGSEPDKPKQIWTQGETQASSAWFPTIDSPNEKHTQELFITVSNNFKTLSNGTFMYSKMNADGTRTDYWKQSLPHAPYLTMMAIGEYAVVKDKWRDMEVNYYVEPKYEKHAKKIFGNTPEMIEFFSTKLGYKFPWDKYSQVVVRDYVSGAMENTSASIFMEALQVEDRELIDDNWDGIIAHELFHQWFGDVVTCESWSNLPLNESFADYSEYLWNEYKYGREEADKDAYSALNQYLAESRGKRENMIRYYYENKEDMFDSHSYAKGGRILHMLRKYVGDEAFFKSLNVYLTKNQFKAAEIHHLRLAFEEVTGEDLNWFFDQWFMSLGHPEIEVQTSFADSKITMKVWQKQDTTYMPIYRLPLQVEIWAGGAKKLENITITKSYQEFTFQSATQPDVVLFDAENQLLGTIKHKKTEPELMAQYLNSDKYVFRMQALDKLMYDLSDEKLRNIAIKALDDKHWALRMKAVEGFKDYSGVDFDKIEAKLKQLAATDKRSYVRASAIEVLSSFKAKNYTDIYKNALSDSSYTVNGAALDAYLQSDATDKNTVLAQYNNAENDNLIAAIAEYYAKGNCDKACNDWFIKKLGTNPNTVLPSYTKYVNGLDAAGRLQGAKEIAKIARNAASPWARFSAYQNLATFTDIAEIDADRKNIKETEKSEMLKRFYNMMP